MTKKTKLKLTTLPKDNPFIDKLSPAGKAFFDLHRKLAKDSGDGAGNDAALYSGKSLEVHDRSPNHGYNPGEDEDVYEDNINELSAKALEKYISDADEDIWDKGGNYTKRDKRQHYIDLAKKKINPPKVPASRKRGHGPSNIVADYQESPEKSLRDIIPADYIGETVDYSYLEDDFDVIKESFSKSFDSKEFHKNDKCAADCLLNSLEHLHNAGQSIWKNLDKCPELSDKLDLIHAAIKSHLRDMQELRDRNGPNCCNSVKLGSNKKYTPPKRRVGSGLY